VLGTDVLVQVLEDLDAMVASDPATTSRVDAVVSSGGFHAVAAHRVAHRLWDAQLRLPARAVASLARMVTGVDIHPAARIGRRAVIDHGVGVVIGETAEVGDDVIIYQGVTLGSTQPAQGKRHPTVGNGVVLGSGAKVLGPVLVGTGARVGANAVVVRDVAPGDVAVGVPAVAVARGSAWDYII
jgi:serine O-acetyltransferase